MLRERLACGIIILLCGSALCTASNTAQGRKLVQASSPPSPSGGGSWDFTVSGVMGSPASTVWADMSKPTKALVVAFGPFAFSANTFGKLTSLILNSGEEMSIEALETDTRGRYHHFKVARHTLGILKAGRPISVQNSEFYIQISGGSSATIEMGWKGQVRPDSFMSTINSVFRGLLEVWVDNYKAGFGAGDCGDFHDFTAVCNNPNQPFGITNGILRRLNKNDPVFPDGRNDPSGSDISPREISNYVCAQESGTKDDGSNALGLTDIFVFFGQFVDHDVGISPVGIFADKVQPLFSTSFEQFIEELPIEIPEDDPVFKNKKEMPFERAVFKRENNREVTPREIINQITSFLDLSQVYGSNGVRARALRSFTDGKLKTSAGNLLPFNGDVAGGIGIKVDNAPDTESRFPVAGDIRASENVNLLALHTIWMREHNKVAEELKAALGSSADDETLYKYARAICIAEYQSILYSEWLPRLLGQGAPSPSAYRYNSGIDASVDAFFTTASFRFGHSMVNNNLWMVKAGSKAPYDRKRLREVFFEPEKMTGVMSDFVRGMMWHEARELDHLVVDDLRSFLFTEDGGPNFDLVALNIQRARDIGIPGYNGARQAFGLPTASRFSDITKDKATASKLSRAYKGKVKNVDAFIGGLAEDKPEGRLFGDLFQRSLVATFTRLRDGDRLFYRGANFEQDLLAAYPRLETILGDGVKFMDVIVRNSDVSVSDLRGRSSVFDLGVVF